MTDTVGCDIDMSIKRVRGVEESRIHEYEVLVVVRDRNRPNLGNNRGWGQFVSATKHGYQVDHCRAPAYSSDCVLGDSDGGVRAQTT